MTGVALLLLAAAVAFGLSRWSRLPAIPLLLLAGVGLRRAGDAFGLAVPEDLIRQNVELGIAMLVFAAGVNLSPRRMRDGLGPVAAVALIQFFALGSAGYGCARLLGYEPVVAAYVGCALSASSTLVAVRQLQERRQMFEPFGRLTLGVLLIQDALIILFMVALERTPEGWSSVAGGLGATVALGGLAFALHRWAIPWITTRGALDEEQRMLGSLALLFGMAGLASALDLPFVAGAFLAGFALAAFPANGLVRGMLDSLSAFFLALFFISVGALLVVPSAELLAHGLIFAAVLLAVTVILVAVVAEIAGYSTRASIETALLLSQTSEFSLVVALAGVGAGAISGELFSMIALLTVGTMTLTPFVARENVAWRLMKLHPRYKKGERAALELGGHAVVLGYGRAGPGTLKFLRERAVPVAVVDDDAAVIRGLIRQGVPCIQGDASDERTLRQANAREARIVLCSIRRTRDAQKVLDHMAGSDVPVIVRTFESDDAAMVEAAGGTPLRTAEISAELFVDWLDANPAKPAAAD